MKHSNQFAPFLFSIVCAKIKKLKEGMTYMNVLSRNIMAGIWALILGEVLAYITGQLEGLTPDYKLVGILAVVMALIAVNAVTAITESANPAKDDKKSFSLIFNVKRISDITSLILFMFTYYLVWRETYSKRLCMFSPPANKFGVGNPM